MSRCCTPIHPHGCGPGQLMGGMCSCSCHNDCDICILCGHDFECVDLVDELCEDCRAQVAEIEG